MPLVEEDSITLVSSAYKEIFLYDVTAWFQHTEAVCDGSTCHVVEQDLDVPVTYQRTKRSSSTSDCMCFNTLLQCVGNRQPLVEEDSITLVSSGIKRHATT